jgi:hypothetical protein
MSEKSSEHERSEPEELDKGFKLRLVKSSMAQDGGEGGRDSDQLLIVEAKQKVIKSNHNSNYGLDSIIYEVSNSSKHSKLQDIGGLSPISKSPKQQYYNTQENFYTT